MSGERARVRDKSCRVEGCETERVPHQTARLCEVHLYRWKRYKAYEVPKKIKCDLKICPVHGQLEIKDIKIRMQKNGNGSQYCKICENLTTATKRHRTADEKETMRLCSKCKITKEKKEFIPSQWKCNLSYCRECRKKIEEKQLVKLKSDPQALKDKWLRRTYNMTLNDYNDLKKKQNNVCAICFNPETNRKVDSLNKKDLSVDHCHASENKGILKIRGLLCHKCNALLGYAKDSIKVLKSAIQYLESIQ